MPTKKPKYFWQYPITGDRERHAQRKVGAATDYATPTGTPLHMPVTGRVTKGRNDRDDDGIDVTIVNSKYEIHLAHLSRVTRTGLRLWRTVFGYSGATGDVTGPHVHGYVIIRKTGKRVSFTEWLRDYVYKGKPSKLPANTRSFLSSGRP